MQFAYLTRFENLRVLNSTGNPICKNPNYRHYLLAHMRKLKYLDYRLVDEDSVSPRGACIYLHLISSCVPEFLLILIVDDD